MRHCSLFVHFFFLICTASNGQFGNEWINFNQSYYKLAVIRKGIHKLSYDDLSAAGVPVNSIDPRRIQIFRRGVEQSIRLYSLQIPANAIFESGEYLEFYGDKNDGVTDVDLYRNPAHHPHSYFNLYSDTAAYFLTWNQLAVQGKRMAEPNPEINVGGLPVETGFTNSVLQVFSNQYSAGVTFGGVVQNSFFDEGEGWTGPIICTIAGGCTGQQDFSLMLPNGATSLSPPQLEVLLVGRDAVGHSFEIYAGPNSASMRLVTNSTFSNFQNFKSVSSLQWTDVAGDGSLVVRVKGLGVGGVRESLSVSYIKIDYLKTYDFTGLQSQSLTLPVNVGNKSYIEIQNAGSGLRLFDITDLTSITLVGTYTQAGNMAAVISGTSASRNIFASSETFIPTIKKVSFRAVNRTDNNYIIISHESLRKPGLSYSDPVKAYGEYRALSAGGGYDTVVVNSSQLYDQFNYGETSARAIYQFLKYMNSGGDTKYLFLIGKGMELNFSYDRNRVFLPTDLKDLVPTAGYPGSDLTFSVGLKGTTYEPAIPTGRLTATNPTEVAAYLNKIKETELLPFDNLWRKNILHISGGINPGEPQAFKYYVDGFKSIAEDVLMGARVETKSKKTFDLETIPIADQVNAGLSQITFFGHSTTNVLDFEIGFVTNPIFGFNNPGKYPSFLVNGCNVGRIYDNRAGAQRSFGEDWILAQNKGAKTFIAHSSFGIETLLRQYSDLYYYHAFADATTFTKGVGDVQVSVARDMLAFSGPVIYNLGIMQQMVLMGDPAVKIFGAPKTDYAIQNDFLEKVSLDGKPITVRSNSFGIKYKIRNYGQARNDSIQIRLTRTFLDNSSVSYDTLIPPVYYENELMFIVPNENSLSGQTSFVIKVDAEDEINEISEQNNQATIAFLVPASSTFNLIPYPYSIVNSPNVELIFQNTNQAPVSRDYQLEIDSVPDFSSSFLIKKKIGAKVLGRVFVTLPSRDSTVYYWRTRLDQPSPTESNEWFISSFSYIADGKDGWTQLRNQQLSENEFISMEFNKSTGAFSFPGTTSTVFVQNFGSANPNPYTNTSFKVNNEELNVSTQGQPCRTNTINIVAFDKTTANPYAAIPFSIVDPRTCGKEPQVINSFTLAEAEAGTNGFVQAITNIATSDSVVLFTIGDTGVQSWSAGLVTKLSELGISSSQLSGYQAGEPMIVFGRKGSAAGTANVIRPSQAPLNAQELVVNESITARPISGAVRSPNIGPSRSWSKVYRHIADRESTDNIMIQIIGVTATNQEQVIYSGNQNPIDLSFVSPATYPHIKIELISSDDINLTPVALKNWIVEYKPVAEGILLFRGPNSPVSLYEGQTWSGKFSYVNLSKNDYSFGSAGDSLQARFIIDNTDVGIVLDYLKNYKSPAPLDSTILDWKIETVGKAGTNDLQILWNNKAAPEQYFFNNEILLEKYLTVIPDTQPPVLDVTVDGRYLMNGDDVSPNPAIKIKIIDENIYYLKTDTLGLTILINNLEANTGTRINFSNPNLSWSPATAASDFEINFTTQLNPGEYELSVQVQDASGNKSGELPYTVSFLVSDESNALIGKPFPNPTNASISFPIRFTGSNLPNSFSLKLYGTTGELISEFDTDDVSGLFIGSNQLRLDLTKLNPRTLSSIYFYKIETEVSGRRYSRTGRILYINP